MKKKEYIAPNFKVIVLRSKHRLLDGSPETYKSANTTTADEENEGGYFD